jgi:hypothetical protein
MSANNNKDDAAVLAEAEQWAGWDTDAKTRAELEALIAAKDSAQLHARFDKRITFGTAGLRGRMEAGASRMNQLTVLQASQVGVICRGCRCLSLFLSLSLSLSAVTGALLRLALSS